MGNEERRSHEPAIPTPDANGEATHDIPRRALTDRETSAYIGMSTSWLRQSRVTGNPDAPPFVKIGRAVRYLRNDLDAWLEKRRRWNTCKR